MAEDNIIIALKCEKMKNARKAGHRFWGEFIFRKFFVTGEVGVDSVLRFFGETFFDDILEEIVLDFLVRTSEGRRKEDF